MPIKIADTLPAREILEKEGIFIMPANRAIHQDIRPLRLLILNLMPTKLATETQLLRLLSNTPLQIETELLQTSSYTPRNTPVSHLESFYVTFDNVRKHCYDGMIITGAPVEHLAFEQVAYWNELTAIMDWTLNNVYSVMHICWGAQAALYHHYGIPKYPLERKMSGVFEHKLCDTATEPLLRGFDNGFRAPHSHHTGVRAENIRAVKELAVLCESDEAGVYLAMSRDGRQIFVTGHPEYDADTLAAEYYRDLEKGLRPDLPYNYFPDNNPALKPQHNWRSHAYLLYSNWLNYYVYQSTPFDISKIKKKS